MRGAGAEGSGHRATLKDVAVAAGVSQSTTSRALSGAGYVAPAVRDRVRQAADRLGYVPHAVARSLRQQTSRSLGLVVSDLRHSFYADLAAGVAARARAEGYALMLVDDQGSAEDELSAARALVSTRLAGVIVTPRSAAVPAYLVAQSIPVVEVDRRFAPRACDAVVPDHQQVARSVAEDLLALGHRRIALLLPDDGWTTGADRAHGYRQALAAAGLTPQPDLLVAVGRDVRDAHRAAADLLSRRDRPTAVLAADDVLAEGLWRAVHDLGLRVPDDISLVSLADARWMALVEPGMTAVAPDVVALGVAAVERLLARLAAPEEEPQTVVLQAQVHSRGSTAAPRTT